MFKFIYSKKDEGIYRVRRILGIKIVTKPLELKLLLKLNDIENRLSLIDDKVCLIENDKIKEQLFKLESYKLYSSSYKKINL